METQPTKTKLHDHFSHPYRAIETIKIKFCEQDISYLLSSENLSLRLFMLTKDSILKRIGDYVQLNEYVKNINNLHFYVKKDNLCVECDKLFSVNPHVDKLLLTCRVNESHNPIMKSHLSIQGFSKNNSQELIKINLTKSFRNGTEVMLCVIYRKQFQAFQFKPLLFPINGGFSKLLFYFWIHKKLGFYLSKNKQIIKRL